ncbi:MAG: putative motility protein [Rhizobacter sp.]|nr:putative motility protein [Rhizobacter sp.]
MDSITRSATAAASSADLGTVQGNAAVSVLKKALNQQASSAAQLIEALPQPALATSGAIGTQVSRYA